MFKLFHCLCSIFIIACAANVNATAVLQYHHISEKTPKATSISPELFAQHMEYLEENDYQVVALPELVNLLREQKPLPDKSVAITFDDGYESVYTEAFPLLKKRGWPFTVFVNTRPLDQTLNQFSTWEQLREMARHGATIANHSLTHTHFLRHLPNEGDSAWLQRIEAEIDAAEQRIEEEVQQRHKFLAYPYGEFDAAIKNLLRRKGYVGFAQHSGPIGRQHGIRDDLQALPRFPFGGTYGDLQDFASKVGSLPLPIEAVHARVKQKSSATEITDTLLAADVEIPVLYLQLRDPNLAKRVQCFASGQGPIETIVDGNTVIAKANNPLPVGRSRYNCTAPSAQRGRYFWYSHFFIRKQANGEWYPEA